MLSSRKETSVKSFVRIKPKGGVFKIEHNTIKVYNKNNKMYFFEFDQVFGPDSTTDNIFNEIVPHLSSKDKKDLTILAYGQTGSGKTHTICGSKQEKGLIHQIIDFLCKTHELRISFIEIYNEKVIDMIDSKEKNLREHNEKFYIQDLTKRILRNSAEFDEIWNIFLTNRRISETNSNIYSSRSHTITRIETDHNIINLVDLAGSENNKRTGNTGERMKESQNINSSLFALNKVVNSIIKNEIRIPYRDSKLTRILKESLNGEGKCFIIATVIDEIDDNGLTVGTLAFASKSRQILAVSKPEIRPIFEANLQNFKIDKLKSSNIRFSNSKAIDNGNIKSSSENINNSKHTDESKTISSEIINENIENTKSSMINNCLNLQKSENSANRPDFENQNTKRIRRPSKHSDNSSLIKGVCVNNQIEMTPITKQKSRDCFIKKAIEYENAENFKLALDLYKTANRIFNSPEIEDKIAELSKTRKISVPLMSEASALRALNSGSFIEIKKLNGIGDKRAKIIADYVNGGNVFESLDDLKLLFNEKVIHKILEGIEK